MIKIYKYTDADIPSMVNIWNEVVKDGLAFPQETMETPESAKQLFSNQSYCGVAKDSDSNKIMGLYILHPNNIGRCGHICNASYAVAKNNRALGIGKKLVTHSLETAKELGFRILQFNAVTSDNEAANTLYPQLGFKYLGTIPGGFRRDGNNYVDINLYYHTLD